VCLGGCGDGLCGPSETQDSCPADCGALLGCFADAEDRALPVYLGGWFTVDGCRAAARAAGYGFAGLEWFGECRAGNQIGYHPLPDAACGTACNANTWEGCGGNWAQRIFTTSCGDGACSSSENDVTCPQDCAGLVGCYADHDTRALPQLLGTHLTIEACRAAARAAGLPLAGLQNGGECWAGTSVTYGMLPETACSATCTADSREGCGGPWANRIFTAAACGDGVCDATESRATCSADCGAPGPVAAVDGKPWGLACGLGYLNELCYLGGLCNEWMNIDSVCEGVHSFEITPIGDAHPDAPGEPAYRYSVTAHHTAPGYLLNYGEDVGQHDNHGFSLQRRTMAGSVTDLQQSDRFALPQGTVCGFHHTRFFAPEWSCMGLDPAVACPAGWAKRRHFDMSSDDRAWVWCEYQDPNHLCTSAACIAAATSNGYTAGLSSTTDSTGWGKYLGRSTKAAECPPGRSPTPFIDMGRPAGDGLGYCQ
jgi:WSC domain